MCIRDRSEAVIMRQLEDWETKLGELEEQTCREQLDSQTKKSAMLQIICGKVEEHFRFSMRPMQIENMTYEQIRSLVEDIALPFELEAKGKKKGKDIAAVNPEGGNADDDWWRYGEGAYGPWLSEETQDCRNASDETDLNAIGVG